MKQSTCSESRWWQRPVRRWGTLVAGLLLSAAASAEPVLTLSVLQAGTAHWELDHLQHAGLDRANGYRLELRPVANLPASRLAVTSGSVQGAVADLLWAQARYEAGVPYLYLPFSSQIGDLVVAEASPIRSLADLSGRRLGVAGGPDSKGWILLQRVAAQQGLDLAASVDLQFGAPPLLSQALKRGQVDAIVTYWHFAARLKGQGGWRSAFRLEELLTTLDLDRNLPVLGYVFPKAWADDHPDLIARFARSVAQAKQSLADEPDHWQRLAPLMQDPSAGEMAALREGYLAGRPQPLTGQRLADLHTLLALTGANGRRLMPAQLFVGADR
ncbi:ABC transporter substrate-binding protein [Marinobacter sp.]|uniref:ABC transporter substrate-binding protein n=1 Tax=Marinobacter sp. TaxID=50741 RepID=UPI0035C6E172